MSGTLGDRSANGAGHLQPGATPQEIAGRQAEDGRSAPPRNEPGLRPSLGKYPMTLGRWPRLGWGWAVGPHSNPGNCHRGRGARTQRKQETDRSGGPCAPRAACSVKLGLALGELCEMVGFLLPESWPQKSARGAEAACRRVGAASGVPFNPLRHEAGRACLRA